MFLLHDPSSALLENEVNLYSDRRRFREGTISFSQ